MNYSPYKLPNSVSSTKMQSVGMINNGLMLLICGWVPNPVSSALLPSTWAVVRTLHLPGLCASSMAFALNAFLESKKKKE